MSKLTANHKDSTVYVLVDADIYDHLQDKTICIDGRGYVFISPSKIKLHRFIMGAVDKSQQVDHINGNKLDNRRENLRLVTNQENARNLHKHKVKSSHGYFGVAYDNRKSPLKKRWCAHIKKDYKAIFLGRFETAKEAAMAYNKKAQELGYLTRNIINE